MGAHLLEAAPGSPVLADEDRLDRRLHVLDAERAGPGPGGAKAAAGARSGRHGHGEDSGGTPAALNLNWVLRGIVRRRPGSASTTLSSSRERRQIGPRPKELRRGFVIAPGARVLMVEDIITTGLSSRECLAAIGEHPGKVVGAACLIDRSGGKAELGVARVALATLDIPAYPADALPPELAATPAVKPGSRALAV